LWEDSGARRRASRRKKRQGARDRCKEKSHPRIFAERGDEPEVLGDPAEN
jgi:hypothetical protein